MSESEQKGRCRSEVDRSGSGGPVTNAIASAIDRLAADVAAMLAKVNAVSPDDVSHFVESEKAWLALVAEQRDAAIRERDEARALLELAQVQRTAAYADRDEARAAVYQLKCSRTETSKERDAAIRERDEERRFRESATRTRDEAISDRHEAIRERDEARADVERLQEELDDREQTEQVKRLREANEKLHRASLNYIHDRDQYKRQRDEALAEVERLKGEVEDRDRRMDELIAERAALLRRLDEARAEVERLKADGKQAPDDLGILQDARGLSERCKELASRIAMQKIEARAEKLLAESSQQQPPAAQQPAAPEPDYYIVTNERDMPIHVSRMHPGAGWGGCTITALYVAPQPAGHGISPELPETQSSGNAAPPPGWLTPEERELLALLKDTADNCSIVHSPWRCNWPYSRVSLVVKAILARAGSPPVVEVPAISARDIPKRNEALAYRAALDKAGVAWKEVPRE